MPSPGADDCAFCGGTGICPGLCGGPCPKAGCVAGVVTADGA